MLKWFAALTTEVDYNCKMHTWAASWQNQQNGMCAQRSQISLGIRPVWSESSLSAWRKLGSLATHWVHSKDSEQTGRMPRLIWVFAGRTVILLVLSWGGSYYECQLGILMVMCSDLLEAKFSSNLNVAWWHWHRAPHIHPSIILIWLKYCSKGWKPPNYHCIIAFLSEALYQSTLPLHLQNFAWYKFINVDAAGVL